MILNKRLNVEAVTDVVRLGRVRWFGHVDRKGCNDWVSFRDFESRQVQEDMGRVCKR